MKIGFNWIVSLETLPVVGSELLLSRTEAETASTLEITVKKCFKTERLTTGKNIYFGWRLNGVLI